ncbi:DNA-binding response regulator, OmpR family, contains REC and winged-helix (wHTH) domain [Gracilibacillus orientalis]|uniref:DNA-binding response regulator, OmpR family, contains REC and winged-helix (WHTH) domain n=1 Tax=Gracilibacillus orientalis TaxID=334253 RepID=A0A1I4ISN7_9BACI|nr:response regulator transcription factor [Gracilibacillus orientalis]SFL57389.1 DNA-binding response regulator, OmpR family, contains REC and winged-helix (wHTH) domain [Gracilibacillus orientalis]
MTKILIIEDEQSIAELERDYLELSGFEADIATNGNEGLAMANQSSYALILLDLMLPGIDGWKLCEQLRATLDIPILMVTARKEDIDKIKGFNRGADDYIVKPFNPNELVARVKAHVSRYQRLTHREQTDPLIEISGLTINYHARRVYVHDRELTFTAKEYDLLYFLATNPNQVFTKEHLLEKIWGFDAIGDSSTVTVHIRKIREKIEQDPSKPTYVETVWGVGYRFKKEN